MSYEYQNTTCNRLFDILTNTSKSIAVLGAAPGAGKTTISHKFINKYLKKYPNHRVLVLTHGQNLLKNQYLGDLIKPNIEIEFTFGDFSSNAQVKVGLPQSIDKLDWKKIDLLVVDEAHHFYNASMVQQIITEKQPKFQLLMTGSPSYFTAFNKKIKNKYGIIYLSGETLEENDVFSRVELDITLIEEEDTVCAMFNKVIKKLKSKKSNLSKLMVAVKTIKDGRKLSKYLKSLGYKVSFTTSQDDVDGETITLFRQNQTNVLIVCQKGILGFSDNYITALIDLRSTQNIEASNQLMSRVLRKHPDNIVKKYCRISTVSDYNREYDNLTKIFGLWDQETFENYTGVYK